MSSPNIGPSGSAALRRHGRRLRIAVTILVGGIVALLGWSFGIGFAMGDRVSPTPAVLRELLPALVYIWGLIRLRTALGGIADGGVFGPAVERALRDLGLALVVGVMLEVFVMPNIVFWVLGPGRGGALLDFDIGNLCAGAIGFALVLVSRLVREAGVIRDELDGFL